jgi:DNA invertase Pin-like site-specific DNA recombinase
MHRPKPTSSPIVAIYVRSSTAGRTSIEEQLTVCRAYAGLRGYTVAEEYVYVDDGASGSQTDRPGWARMLHDAELEGGAPFQVLIMREINQIGRFEDPRMIDCWIDRLRLLGVRVECTDASSPSADPIAYFLQEIERVRDSHERQAQIRRMARARECARRRRAGRYVSAPAPFGFALIPEHHTAYGWREAVRSGNWLLARADDGSAEVLQRIFVALADGMSLPRLAAEMNASGTPAPRGASRWTASRIRRIVRNPVNVGDMIWPRADPDGGPLFVAGYVANPPVSRELFDQVQRRLRRS